MSMKGLTREELQVVLKHHCDGFAACLQAYIADYPVTMDEIQRGRYPSREELAEMNNRIRAQQEGFDWHYFQSLPCYAVNPLRVEQEAWRVLSPHIKDYVDMVDRFLAGYSPGSIDQQTTGQLLSLINNGWLLIQDWNVISNSFKAKKDRRWCTVPDSETDVHEMMKKYKVQSVV